MSSDHCRGLALCGLAVVVAVYLLGAEVRTAGEVNAGDGQQAHSVTERSSGLTVDFVAVREDGTPVADLQASDVEIRLDGRVRGIRTLRLVTTGPPPNADAAAARTPPPFGTNGNVTVGRSIVLLVDQESLVAGREQMLRDAVEGLLAQLTPADRTMVVALPFGGVMAPFTSDPARVRLATAGLTGQGTSGESGSDMACRTRQFLESLEGFLTEHAGRSTPLTIALFTAGLAGPRRDAPMALAPGMCELRVDDFQRIGAVAGAARANVYMLQPADIGLNAAGWRESIGGSSLGSDNPLEGIEHLAGVSGAARLPLDATGTGSLLKMARESSAYYVAELEPDRREAYGRSRPLAVKVARSGVTVRARPEITFAERSQKPPATRLVVADLLASPVAATELPLRVAGFTVREPGGQLRVGVVVEPVDPAVSLASVGAVLLAHGDTVGRWFAPDASERPLLGAMPAVPGTYRLRVAAIDRTGRPGIAEDVVDVRLTSVGPLSLGSLMLGVSRDEGVALQLEFSSEPTVIASFDIYGGVAGMGLAATLEVARQVEGPALVSSPLGLSRADEHRVVATGSVPAGALPPGDYVVRGVITLEDGTTGRVVRTLRKVKR